MKRLFDIIISAALLLILSPFIISIVCLVKYCIGAPVFFTQLRPGRNCQPIKIIKFRAMTDGRDINGKPFPDEQRITKLGMILRGSSLDEIPQLFCVLKGDMSLVGPRPLLMEYLPLYTPEQVRRHEVKPGITGWAQVNGRNALSWEERFKLDVWYVDHQSLWLDLKILWLTILRVIQGDGINQPGHATMEKFRGTR